MGLHGGIINRIAAQQGIAALSDVDRCAQKTSIGFCGFDLRIDRTAAARAAS